MGVILKVVREGGGKEISGERSPEGAIALPACGARITKPVGKSGQIHRRLAVARS